MKCYSKFGDVVYTLTRFFRDCGTRGPPKLELKRNEHQENVRVSESSQLLDKFHLENRLVPQTTGIDPTCSLDSASSTKQTTQGNISSHLREVVPANRSSLLSDKISQGSILKCSSNLTCTGKESLISGKKSIQDFDGETSDLGSPCILKKRRLLITGPHQSKRSEKFDEHFSNLVKNENLQLSKNVSTQNPQGKGEVLVDDEIITQKKNVAHNIQDQKAQTVPRSTEESKGSAFLIQVREKLTDGEYKEFVGFMKALKSKAMKIGQVLQSIARLFSAPDRLSLLHGFKAYVPAKYHSLYDRYLCTNSDAAGV